MGKIMDMIGQSYPWANIGLLPKFTKQINIKNIKQGGWDAGSQK